MKLPEPGLALTPELLAQEVRKWDLVIAAGVALFALLLGVVRDNHPVIPMHLAAGRAIAEGGVPKADPFSFVSPPDKTWVNPSWLFDLLLYKLRDEGGYLPGVLKALAAAAAAALLLVHRRPGPTLWWAAICAFLAMVAVAPRVYLGPEIFGLTLFAGVLALWRLADGQRTWPLYAAVGLTALWANLEQSAFLAPAVLLLGALGSAAQLALPAGSNFSGQRPSAGWVAQAFLAAGLATGALAATPFTLGTLTFPWEWFTKVLPQAVPVEKSFFGWLGAFDGSAGPGLGDKLLTGQLAWAELFWLGLAAVALATAALNLKRLNVARVLFLALGLALPVLAARYFAPSALLLAAVAAQNGGEAFLDAFGTAARTTSGWLLWSQAGRFATILGIFWGLLMGITARFSDTLSRSQLGIGAADEFYFDAAATEWFDKSGLKGRAFCPSAVRLPATLSWLAPERKHHLDHRWQLFADPGPDGAASPLQEYARLRALLDAGAPPPDSEWVPYFDRLGITHVTLDPEQSVTRRIISWGEQRDKAGNPIRLRHFRPLYFADRIAVFGRTDKTADQATVEKLRLRANAVAFQAKKPASDKEPRTGLLDRPPAGFPARPLGLTDSLYRYRNLKPAGLNRAQMQLDAQDEIPGSLFLAVNEYRRALVQIPESSPARMGLARTYFGGILRLEAMEVDGFLQRRVPEGFRRQQELLAISKARARETPRADVLGAELPPPADAGPKPAPPAPRGALRPPETQAFHPLRHYQIACAFHDALRSCRPEGLSAYVLPEERLALDDYAAMAIFHAQNHHLDLALDVLKSALAAPPGRDGALAATLKEQHERLAKAVRAGEEAVAQALAEAQAQNPTATEDDLLAGKIIRLAREGLHRQAVAAFENASRTHPEYDQVRPLMARLYLELGMAEKSLELLKDLSPSAPQFGHPTEHAELRAHCLLAYGDYDGARRGLEEALGILRRERVERALDSVRLMVGSGTLFLPPPPNAPAAAKPIGSFIDRREVLENLLPREGRVGLNLALLLVEMGEMEAASKAFAAALAADPQNLLAPVARIYAPFLPGFKMPAPKRPYLPEEELEAAPPVASR